MADLLKMDPQRIARLRDPARYQQVDPERVLSVAAPTSDGAIVDVGAGVGFVALPFARRFPTRRVIACDILAGMLELLASSARDEGLDNLDTRLMPDPVTVPLADGQASLLIMLQVHHELDDARTLMAQCRRVVQAGAPMVIIDWKDEDLPGMPQGGRRVARSVIIDDLRAGGFSQVESHDLYPLHCAIVAR